MDDVTEAAAGRPPITVPIPLDELPEATAPAEPGPPVKRPVPRTREEKMSRDAEERAKGEQILDALEAAPQGTPEPLAPWGVRHKDLFQKVEFWLEETARDFYNTDPNLILYRRDGEAWTFVECHTPEEG